MTVSNGSHHRMPAWYIPHGGGPCFFMEWNPPDLWRAMEVFLRGIPATLPALPSAIVMVTAHWQADAFTVATAERPGMLYDYHGFPAHTYRLKYPAAGEPALGARLVALLQAAGLPAAADPARGFDHGTFIPLMLMFPEATIPVVQLSLQAGLDAQLHLRAGAALERLRDEGVLIVGSGMSFHNMRAYGDARFGPVSDAFDQWLDSTITASSDQRRASLAAWESAPGARLCHPPRAEEHLLPLMVAAGAAGDDPGTRVYGERIMHTMISGYRFG
jgi:aromatic ring-opening dioxygenase catalytic subunit (LigB family)